MIKKTILYVGGFRLPDKNSSAIRVLGIARMLNDLGYITKVGGKTDYTINTYTDVDFWSAEYVGEEKYKLDSQIEPILAKVKEVGKGNIKAIIAYNYAPIAFYKLFKYCKREGITLIPDITEWYLIDGKVTPTSVLRVLLTNWRIAVISPRCKNSIYAVHYMSNRFKKNHTLVLPQVSLVQKTKDAVGFLQPEQRIKFVYVGYPGIGFSKERVDWCIETFAELSEQFDNFEYHVIGVNKETVLEYNAILREPIQKLGDKLTLHGRQPHEVVFEHLKNAQFNIFIRPENRVSKVGYPGKAKEAFDFGLPLFTNNTGDLALYTKDGVNGFIVDRFDKKMLRDKLEKVLSMSVDEINKLKQNCLERHPFHPDILRRKTKIFLENLK